MSFHEVRLSEKYSLGARGGAAGHRTRIITTNSGYEYRNAEWSRTRGQWHVAFPARSPADMAEFIAFFRARQGRLYGFRFRDPSDYVATSQAIQTNPQGAVQLAKLYTSGGVTSTRFITKPVTGTITGIPEGDVDLTTGIVTGHAAGTVVSFQFDVPVRFDIDDLEAMHIDGDNIEWPDVPIVELRP